MLPSVTPSDGASAPGSQVAAPTSIAPAMSTRGMRWTTREPDDPTLRRIPVPCRRSRLRCGAFVVPPRRRLLLRMRGHRRIERAEDARTHLRREPSVQHHGAVVLVPEGEASVLVLRIGPLGLLRALGPAVETHELLHLMQSPHA